MTARILLAGGGTGGHLFPALAIAEILRSRGAEVLFVGTRTGVEARILPEKDFPLECLWLSGFNRRRIVANLLLPIKILVSLMQSVAILRRFRPRAALGTGGYVCGPILLMAVMSRVPLFLQEQNSYPGVTTRILAPFASKIFLNFEEAASYLPKRAKWLQVGNPVRTGFAKVDRQEAIAKWGLEPSLPTLLVFGGSQGALQINRAVHEILPELGKLCNLIWSRGSKDTSEPSGWSGLGNLIVKPFIEDMPHAYSAADLAVCRSGAMTLSELQVASLPAILVPYPYAAGDHQRHNARAFSRQGGALVIENRELNGERLFSEVQSLFDRKENLEKMRRALADLPHQDTAKIIADEILKIAQVAT